jgi:hypothetical protein
MGTGKSWLELKSITSVLAGLGVSLAGFAAAMAEQARKLAPDAAWERWLEGAGEPPLRRGSAPGDARHPHEIGRANLFPWLSLRQPAGGPVTSTTGWPRPGSCGRTIAWS